MSESSGTELSDEDRKLVTLARGARARIDAADGAAVRDLDGRSYASAAVALPSLALAGLELAVAQAAAGGAAGLEAAAVVTESDPSGIDLSIVRDLGGTGVRVYVADASGDVIAELTT
jgi:hypothetical protein